MGRGLSLVTALALGLSACARKQPEVRRDGLDAAVAIERVDAAPPFPGGSLGRDPASAESGPLAWATWGEARVLLLADADDRSLLTLDAATLDLRGRQELPGEPSAIRIAGGHAYVALRDASRIVDLEPHGTNVGVFRTVRSLATRPDPVALSSTETELLVLSAFGRSLERFPLANESAAATRTDRLAREPVALLVLPNGDVVVGHASQGPLSVLKPDGSLSAIDLSEPDVCTEGGVEECMTIATLPATQHFALASFEGSIVSVGSLSFSKGTLGTSGYGAAALGRFEPQPVFQGVNPPMPIRRKEPTAPAVALTVDLLDPSAKKAGSPVGRERGGCALPRAAVVDPVRKEVLVACLGDDVVVRFKLAKVGGVWAATDARAPLPALGGPIALARDDGRVIVWGRESRALSAFTFDKDKAVARARVVLPLQRPLDAVWARGRALFHSAERRISSRGLACAHCHPGGRDDDVVWSTPRGPRRPLSLAGAPKSGLGWDAQSPTLEAHVKTTIVERLGGSGLSGEDTAALLAYLQALAVPRDPVSAEDAGSKAFAKAGCASCHLVQTGYSDGLVHDVGNKTNRRTPRLVGLGGRRSFFHDARYTALGPLLDDRTTVMGQTGDLSAGERTALEGFLDAL